MENLLHLKSKSLFKDLESFLTLFLIQGKGGDLSDSEWTVENILAEIGDNKKHNSEDLTSKTGPWVMFDRSHVRVVQEEEMQRNGREYNIKKKS